VNLAISRPDAEAAVIGAAFLDAGVVEWLDLDESCFSGGQARLVWQTMAAMSAASKPVDSTSVLLELTRGAPSEADAVKRYIGECLAAVVTPDNVEYYAQQVREDATTRRVLLEVAAAPEMVRRGLHADDLLSELMQRLGAVTPSRRNAGMSSAAAAERELAAVRDHLRRVADGQTAHAGVPTGLHAYDRSSGGIPRGTLTILASRPGHGKSTLIRRIASYVARTGVGGAHVLSYEDGPRDFGQRLLADEAGVRIDQIRSRTLTEDEVLRLGAASELLSRGAAWHLDHTPGWRIDAVERRVRALKRKLGTVLVCLDYEQKMPKPRGISDRTEAHTENVQRLSELAATEDIALIMGCQLLRGVDQRDDPTPLIADLKGTGAHDEAGKMILGLMRPAKYWRSTYPKRHVRAGDPVDPSLLELHVLKNHQGDEGQFDLDWDLPLGRITG